MNYRNYHCGRKALTLSVERETPNASLLRDPRNGNYFIDYSDGSDQVEELRDPDEFDNLAKWWTRQQLSIETFRVRTTFIGADGPSEFYYSTEEKAQEYLDSCQNGEIEIVTVVGMDALPGEGCTWDDIRTRGGEVR